MGSDERTTLSRVADGGATATILGDQLVQFHVTPLRPCPYIAGRVERKIVTPITGGRAKSLYDSLIEAGFRRSHIAAYCQVCPGCEACISVRVEVNRFQQSRSMRRVAARNAGVRARVLPARVRPDHFALFKRYLDGRHAEGAMAAMDTEDYRALIEESGVESRVAEFRQADGSLFGVCLFDIVADGLSAVYSFYRPDDTKASPGTYMILWLIESARVRRLAHVYLGYWIDGCQKMDYKTRFRPLERLGRDGWRPFDDDADAL